VERSFRAIGIPVEQGVVSFLRNMNSDSKRVYFDLQSPFPSGNEGKQVHETFDNLNRYLMMEESLVTTLLVVEDAASTASHIVDMNIIATVYSFLRSE
jgi:hypothetical protein